MTKDTEKLITTIAGALGVGLSAFAMTPSAPVWIPALAAVCSFVAGAYGKSKPSDAKSLHVYRQGLGRESDPE